ncbi:MauE/DoxX family redox-associated membrane protein [Nocardiopsis coralliicola]
MLATFLQIQAAVLALLLALGAVGKAFDSSGAGRGPGSLLPVAAQRPFKFAAVAVEAVLAVVLLVSAGPLGTAARVAAAVVFAGSAFALAAVRRRDPQMSCGCFGGLSSEPVGRRTIARPALLAAAAAGSAAVLPAQSGIAALAALDAASAGLLAAEVAVLAALSPELSAAVARAVRPEPCEVRRVPVARSMRRLRRSAVWRANPVELLSTDPVDVWRQGCWRLLRFDGTRYGRAVDVVYAVELSTRRPRVRAAVIDAGNGVTQAVLGELADAAAEVPLPRTKDGEPHPTGTVRPHRGKVDAEQSADVPG